MTTAGQRKAAGGYLNPGEVARFRREIYRHYGKNGRRLPWRETRDPYATLVSEFMLQQTPVARVLPKYAAFLAAFPDFAALNQAPLVQVLARWQGLGYPRRALALKECAGRVLREYAGRLPEDPAELQKLPGIGPATAGAVCAFAFGRPVAFLETNIRRVFRHFFFSGEAQVPDRELLPLVARTLDRRRVREWYYALMDYGVWLKQSHPAPKGRNRPRQAPYAGSDRQVRGEILRLLLATPGLTLAEVAQALGRELERVRQLAAALQREGFLLCRGQSWCIAGEEGCL
ncbi:MAG: A/G-specific adenine glycosylase [Syntrophobacterales bacterium]|nr:A/G-specific adenine glycosylase [Syntrophobacterales bacterium]